MLKKLSQLSTLDIKGHKSVWSPLNLTEKAFVIAQKHSISDFLSIVLIEDPTLASKLEGAIQFFSPKTPIYHFPEWETLPYDQFSPHQDIISNRIKTLYHLPSLKKGILILPISTLTQKIVPITYTQQHTFILRTKDVIETNSLKQNLQDRGYTKVNQVIEHGEFSIRGSIIDLFPMGSKAPFRIDMFDDEVDTIRQFNPETQISTHKIDSIELLPAKEYPLNEVGISQFRTAFRSLFGDGSQSTLLYKSVSNGQTINGLEYYLPLFHEKMATLLDYFPKNAIVFEIDDALQSISTVWKNYQERYDITRHNPDYPVLSPEQLIISEDYIRQELKQWHRIQLFKHTNKNNTVKLSPVDSFDVKINTKHDKPLHKLNEFIENLHKQSHKLLIIAETTGRRETLLSLLSKYKHIPKVINRWNEFLENEDLQQIIVSPLENTLQTEEFTVITESQILGKTTVQQRSRKKTHDNFNESINNLVELELGHPIVHIDHGVGRYRGLQTLEIQNTTVEFLTIEYYGEDKLYVPVTSLHLISLYSGAQVENAPLHKLGTDKWQKSKKKASEKVYDIATDLLNIYAERESKTGQTFNIQNKTYLNFCTSFPFEETPDQLQAIQDVLNDLKSNKPMERLICGDVGFGKTEVAMRAAFIVAFGGNQVAILVPTTLLAQQHYENFKNRFADWPIEIGLLSRFQTAKEQKNIQQQILENKIDIIIGTHKIINKSMKFSKLGLIIIDEEHRFGVRQKETIKQYKTSIDTLTMTATPIPRTLNMAMNNLRDISIIATPPEKRLAIQTFVQQWNVNTVKEACLREIRRGGQVYFLFNHVEKIENMAEELRELLPEARINVAHGQMPENKLERIMQDFYHRRFNVLVASTIIENGIDVPTANTIIIYRADKFGLAQLHQLRGRVGRAHHRAYAYMFTPPDNVMTPNAKKRLEAIKNHSELGAGFMLASHDLEIRGAGELLGEGQSGQIHEIGFNLYSDLLERTIQAIKSGKNQIPSKKQTEIDLGEPSLIPEDYLPDVHSRLVLYKRISNAKSLKELHELEVEMIDRFSLLPTQTKVLFAVTQLKLEIQKYQLPKIEARQNYIRIQFGNEPNIDPLKLIQLIQKNPNNYKLKGQTELKYLGTISTLDEKITKIKYILKTMEISGD